MVIVPTWTWRSKSSGEANRNVDSCVMRAVLTYDRAKVRVAVVISCVRFVESLTWMEIE